MAPRSDSPDVPARMLGKPHAWSLFAWVLLVIPILGYLLRSNWAWTEVHPALNAVLNGTSFFFLSIGFIAIKSGDRRFHKFCMLSAVTASGVFLVSYVARVAMTGTHTFQGSGFGKTVYLSVLFSHMVLAAVLVPLAFTLLYFAFRGSFSKHKRLARWAFPIWMYVSATGVAVYFMLYH